MVLTALADEPRHGYAIAQEVKSISQGRVVLRTGTLYSALERLANDGLIEVHHEEVVDGRNRRVYTLAAAGRARLAQEAQRLADSAREARRRLGLAVGEAGATA